MAGHQGSLMPRTSRSPWPERGSASAFKTTPTVAVLRNGLSTRVIDVESLEPHIYTTSPIDENMKYITLSHCWGDEQVLKLKTSNHQTLENSIPIDSLPQTFCDASTIARKLGLKYLWIDSPCIIQDLAEDWQRESPTMNQVYSNSTVTVAALWGANSYAGCFIQRQPLSTQSCTIL